MEKRNVKDDNGENLVIIIKLELENEEHNDDETVGEKELLYTEKEGSETQIENTDKQRDTSLENESIGDLFCDAFKDIPNPESSQKAADELKFVGSEPSLVNDEDNLVKCRARVVFVDEISQLGTMFNYVPNLSTTPQKTAGIEAGSGRGETSGKETLKNKCQKCVKDFANKTSLLLHLDDKHPEVRNPRPLPCKFCDDIFTIKPRLVDHMDKVHGKSYGHRLGEREIIDRDENFGVCRWCGKEYKREKALRNHERLHTGETPYNFKLCGNSFEFKARMDAHVRSRHKVSVSDAHPPIDVKDVNEILNNASSFKMKAKNVNRDKRRLPPTDYFKREQNVIFDGDDTTNIDEGPFYCSHGDCGKSFMINLKLKVHERIHKRDFPFACDWEECGKKFALSAHCKRHFRTHTGEKPHVCNVCQKRFSRADHLKKHSLTHIGDPPLKDHMKKHTGDRPRPHICNECNRRFFQKEHLKNHLRTHTGEKPYVCIKCNKRFSRTDHLKKHTTRCVAA